MPPRSNLDGSTAEDYGLSGTTTDQSSTFIGVYHRAPMSSSGTQLPSEIRSIIVREIARAAQHASEPPEHGVQARMKVLSEVMLVSHAWKVSTISLVHYCTGRIHSHLRRAGDRRASLVRGTVCPPRTPDDTPFTNHPFSQICWAISGSLDTPLEHPSREQEPFG
jgi:hypothetical protein